MADAARRPRKAKKAVLVSEAGVAAEAPLALLDVEPEVAFTPAPVVRPEVEPAPALPEAEPTRVQTLSAPEAAPEIEPVSAARAALLAALEAAAEGGVTYERAERAERAATVEDAPEVPSAADVKAAEDVEDAEDAPSVADLEDVEDAPVALLSEGTPAPDGTPARRGLAILKALDDLPPIRLPLGPAIPWRYGLPGLVAVVLCLGLLGRPTAHAQTSNSNTFKLPAESETYAVTQDSPLFAKTQQQQQQQQQQEQQQPQQPIGVAEPAGLGVDMVDLTLKLVAVLAIAYGSLVVLKRLGIGGAASASSSSGGSTADGLRVVSSLTLAPNRTVHVIRAPDGKNLLLGATPGQVNLITELGEMPDATAGGAGSASFLDILTNKLQQR